MSKLTRSARAVVDAVRRADAGGAGLGIDLDAVVRRVEAELGAITVATVLAALEARDGQAGANR